MVDKSIAYRLSLFISIAVIIVFITFVFAYFLFSRNIFRENIEYKVIGFSVELSHKLNSNFQNVRNLSVNLSQQIKKAENEPDIEKILKESINQFPVHTTLQVFFDSTLILPNQLYEVRKKDENIEYRQLVNPEFRCKIEKQSFNQSIHTVLPSW